MKTLQHFRRTPTDRLKIDDVVVDGRVTVNAAHRGIKVLGAFMWSEFTLRIPVDNAQGDSYHINMDRETAASIVARLVDLLKEINT